MKLTEDQLKGLFQQQSVLNHSTINAADCLSAPAASDQRLAQAENLVNDFTAAQAMKVAFKTQNWSQQIATEIKSQSISSWFNWLSNPFKTTVTAGAFALALAVALPNLSHKEQQILPTQAQVDVISNAAFESDVLNSGTFDKSSDSLFNGSFG